MHLIQSYALTAGQKIEKPNLIQEFYPVNSQQYIVLQPFSKPIKNYDYWQDVIRWVKKYAPEYDIVQIGGPNEQDLPFCINTQGKTSLKQINYIIANAKLFVGTDSFGGHVAGVYDIPSIILYSNNYVHNVKPYFLSPEKFTSFTSPDFKYPPFSLDIGYSPLNKITPDLIVNAILAKLGKGVTINKYSFIGESYHRKIVEWIPTEDFNYNVNTNCVSVRMDIAANEYALYRYAKHNKVLIYTDKPINPQLLAEIKHNIAQIIYEVKTLDLDLKWFSILNKLNINWQTYSYLPIEEINKIKLDFCELGTIFHKDPPAERDLQNKKYLSGKIVCAYNKYYGSVVDALNDKPIDLNQYISEQAVPDSKEFLKEIDFMAIL